MKLQKKIGGIIRLLAAGIILLPVVSLASVDNTVRNDPADQVTLVKYEHGCFSIRATEVSIISLLDEISKIANISIYTASKIHEEQRITADFKDRPLIDTLRAILDGYNYLVIMSPEESDRGLHLLASTDKIPSDRISASSKPQGMISHPVGMSPEQRWATVDGRSAASFAVSDRGRALSGERQTDKSGGSWQHADSRISEGRQNIRLGGHVQNAVEHDDIASSRAASVGSSPQLEFSDDSPMHQNTEQNLEVPAAPNPEATSSEGNPEEWQPVFANPLSREDYLRSQIDRLTIEIESGADDRGQEFLDKIGKDPKYRLSARQQRQLYQQELDEMIEGEFK